jgi:hypothetical protein
MGFLSKKQSYMPCVFQDSSNLVEVSQKLWLHGNSSNAICFLNPNVHFIDTLNLFKRFWCMNKNEAHNDGLHNSNI